MTDAQFERLFSVLERIATSLELIETHADALSDCVDPLETGEGEETTYVFNIWKEGEGS